MKKSLLYLLFFIMTFIFFVFIYLFSSADVFDNKLRDEMFLLRGEINTTNSVAIVDIDEKSLKVLGQWPWSRDKIAKILVNLTQAKALIIGLDMFFAEVDTKSPAYLSKKYNLNIKKNNYDKYLSHILENTPTILGFYFNFENNITKNILPNIPAIFIQKNLKEEYLFQAKGYIGNIPILQNSAYSGGFVNMIPDVDGVVRHVPLVLKYDDLIYPSLAFEMFRIASGENKIIINYSDAGVDNIQIGNYKIKTDRFGRLFINYRGDKKKFKYISAIDIYNNDFNKSLIKDKFVLIGTSAGGLFDLRVTPFNTVFPGVEVHANIIDNLIKGDFLYHPDIAEIIDILSLFIIASLVFLIFYYFNAIISLLFLILLSIFYFGFVYYLMFYEGYIINILLPLVEMVILAIIFGTINYLLEAKKAEALKYAFSKKVSPKVMEELLENKADTILTPKNKEVTIFFSDIRGFTSISEKLSDPKKVIELLNFYMIPMVDNITFHKGTVDKFIGDAIMAYWNAPVDIKNHADEAVSSAIEQIEMLEKLNLKINKLFGITLKIGIGINSGIATIGEMGSRGRADYTVIGDNVNLASRLEGLNKIYYSSILISEFTYNLLTKEYIIRDIDLVRVKGKNKVVKIYEVLGFGSENFEEYHIALELYRSANFKRSKEIFEKIYKQTNDPLYKMYLKRCEYLIQNPPKNFDGVWSFI